MRPIAPTPLAHERMRMGELHQRAVMRYHRTHETNEAPEGSAHEPHSGSTQPPRLASARTQLALPRDEPRLPAPIQTP